MTATLTAEQLAVRLGGRVVLDRIDLQLQAGQITAVLGENGSGKSTLLRALAGILPAHRGRVLLGSKPLEDHSASERSQALACVLQESHLAFDFALEEVVCLGPPPRVPRGARRKQAAMALTTVGISQLAKRPWGSLSGGERQRGHLARALASCAPLLLLDEPHNHLDIASRVSLRQILAREAERGVAVLITTHSLEEAAWADDILILAKGLAVESGPPSKVLRPDCIERVFGVQARELTDPMGGPPAFRLGPPPGDPGTFCLETSAS